MNASWRMHDLLGQAQLLSLIYLGIIHGLFVTIGSERARPNTLAAASGRDAGYVGRWLDAAVAAQLVAVDSDGRLSLGPRGEGLDRVSNVDVARALQAVYSVLVSDAMSPNFLTGHRPGYAIVDQFTNLRPWYGTIFESLYRPVWEREIEPNLSCIAQADRAAGLCVDYGCGDGWLLRRIASTTMRLRCLGLTDGDTSGFPPSPRVSYSTPFAFFADSSACEIIILNKVAHHLGTDLENTLQRIVQKLAPGGSIVIWDVDWPVRPGVLSDGEDRFFLNLIEHVQQSEFVARDVLVGALRSLGLRVTDFVIRRGRDILIVGTA